MSGSGAFCKLQTATPTEAATSTEDQDEVDDEDASVTYGYESLGLQRCPLGTTEKSQIKSGYLKVHEEGPKKGIPLLNNTV